jgi:LPS O-antigen subunit length determinant protein (WzzB/FepE family)
MAPKIETADFENYPSKIQLTPLAPREEISTGLDLSLALDKWKLIAIVTLISVIAAFVYAKFLATKWYQATAIIEPVPAGAVENRVEGGMGGIGAGGMATLLLTSGSDSQAQEYMTILRSFSFNTEIAMKHNLTPILLSDESAEKPKTERELRMRLFEAQKSRFAVDYSIQARSLNVHYIDRDPIVAQQILQYYLDDLRGLLRQEAIANATAAIDSLEKEAKHTGDPLLSDQLYSLVARQVQRQKLAQVEADFAFRVLEPPISPDRPYWPRARITCFIALLFVPMIMGAGILVLASLSRWRARPQPPSDRTRRRLLAEHEG